MHYYQHTMLLYGLKKYLNYAKQIEKTFSLQISTIGHRSFKHSSLVYLIHGVTNVQKICI